MFCDLPFTAMDRSRPVALSFFTFILLMPKGILCLWEKTANYKIGPPTVQMIWALPYGCLLQCHFFCVHDHLGDCHICAEQQRISFHETLKVKVVWVFCEAHTINQKLCPHILHSVLSSRPYHQWPLWSWATIGIFNGGFIGWACAIEFDFNQIRSDLVSFWKFIIAFGRK